MKIKKAEIEFGDLTVFIGHNGTGKSTLLQFLKLLLDKDYIHSILISHGINWDDKYDFLKNYFGEGKENILDGAYCEFNEKMVIPDSLVERKEQYPESIDEKCHCIPSQRVFAFIHSNYPEPFKYFNDFPFVFRNFSEQLSDYLNTEAKKQSLVDDLSYPVLIKQTIDGFRGPASIPFKNWSSGQKEFVSFLMSIANFLLNDNVLDKSNKANKKWLVIEYPELNLHPNSLVQFLKIILFLLSKYRICIISHSSIILDFIWVMNQLKQHEGTADDLFTVLEVDESEKDEEIIKAAQASLKKDYKIYYFEQDKNYSVTVKDISELSVDPDGNYNDYWGGIEKLCTKACDIVAEVVTREFAKSGNKRNRRKK
jgi:ABC-type multidrug transport system fused ATPase/permease subunit